MTTVALDQLFEHRPTAEIKAPSRLSPRKVGRFAFYANYAGWQVERAANYAKRPAIALLGALGITAAMTGLAQKGLQTADIARNIAVEALLDNPELQPVTEQGSANLAILAGTVATAASVAMTFKTGMAERPFTSAGLDLFSEPGEVRDWEAAYKKPPIERFDEWAEATRTQLSNWAHQKVADFASWRQTLRERYAAQVDPANSNYEPFMTTKVATDVVIFGAVD